MVALVGLVLTVRSVDQLGLAVFWQFLPYAAVRRRLLGRDDRAEGRRAAAEQTRGGDRAALHDSLPLFVSLISGQVIVNSSAILLGQLAGYRQVGLFGAGRPADQRHPRRPGRRRAGDDAPRSRGPRAPARDRISESSSSGALIGCYGLAGLLLAVTAPMLIPWYLGDGFADAVPVVQLMGVATVLTGVTRTFALDLSPPTDPGSARS